MMVPARLSVYHDLDDIKVFDFHQNPITHCHWFLLLSPQTLGSSEMKDLGKASQLGV